MNEDLIKEAEKFIKEVRKIQKMVYQLAFIATSEDDEQASKAHEMLKKLVDDGIVSERMVMKALEDVRRYRLYVLDRVKRREEQHEAA
ncbi:MAG: hypothetical protein QXK88_10630 [Desulfurococcaceae archaeon]